MARRCLIPLALALIALAPAALAQEAAEPSAPAPAEKLAPALAEPSAPASADEPEPNDEPEPTDEPEGATQPSGPMPVPEAFPAQPRFKVVELHDEVSLGMAAYVQRAVDSLAAGEVLVLDINTFGGRVNAAVQIRDALLSARQSKAWTVAYVHPRAISAGALISLATDVIVIAPAATIGAATPVQAGGDGTMKPVEEKTTSYMRNEMRATAEARGRSGDIGEAMVNADFDIPGLSPEGKLLTLAGDQILEWGVASFEAETLDALVERLGGSTAPVEHIGASWAEEVASWLTSSALSGLLMTIGMLGLMVGLYTGGSPFLLSVGGVCLGLFFGHHVVDLAGLEEIVLVVLGAVLIVVELSAPGGFVAGAVGFLLVLIALVLALVNLEHVPLGVQWEAGLLSRALSLVFGSFLATGVLMYVAAKALPGTRLGSALLLDAAIDDRAMDDTVAEHAGLIGRTGTAATDLRPSGKVTVAGRRHEAVAERGFIAAGTPVEVRGQRGFSLLVAEADAGEEVSS